MERFRAHHLYLTAPGQASALFLGHRTHRGVDLRTRRGCPPLASWESSAIGEPGGEKKRRLGSEAAAEQRRPSTGRHVFLARCTSGASDEGSLLA